jgi:hypothetical protein
MRAFAALCHILQHLMTQVKMIIVCVCVCDPLCECVCVCQTVVAWVKKLVL